MKIVTGVLGILLFAGAAWAGDFTDNHNGTVTDNVTGLIWQQQDTGVNYTWEEAILYCEGLAFASYKDWRLPNINELESIVDRSRYYPAIDPVFTNTQSSNYWSSTTYVYNASLAWYVYFYIGNVYYDNKNSYMYVRCVRGGQ